MIRTCLAIAGISIRAAIRSRVVLSLLFFLLIVMIGIPLTVQGDGTPGGQVQVLLNYSLGMAWVILALVTVWAGCASVSTEIEDRRIQLVTTKPVHPWQVWMGKWLGLLVLNMTLVAFCGALTFGMLEWSLRPSRITPEERAGLHEEILVARREIRPALTDVSTEARAALQARMDEGLLPEGMDPERAYRVIEQNLLARAYSISTGGRLRWQFSLPLGFDRSQTLYVRYRLVSSRHGAEPVVGTWLAGAGPEPSGFSATVTNTPGGAYTLRVPAALAGQDGALTLEYANVNPGALTVVFSPDDGVRAFLRVGAFAENYVRALLLMLAQLAFLAAIGVAAGCCFSLPVAAFAAAWLALLISISPYLDSMAAKDLFFTTHHGPVHGPTIWDHFFHVVFRILSTLIGPLSGPDPLAMLTSGLLVAWTTVAVDFAVRVVLFSGLLAWLSSWILGRREVALPV